MRILIILEGFFPGVKYGGPPVSVNNLCSLLSEHEFFLVATNHDLGASNPYNGILDGWNTRDNCQIMYLRDEKYNKFSFEKIIKSIGPDLLYLQGLFQKCVLPCLVLAKKYNLRVLLAPRGELCAGAFKKKYKKIPYIYALRILNLLHNVEFQSTSDEETLAIKQYLNVDQSHIYCLPNIPTISESQENSITKIKGAANFIFLSRIVRKKNLLSAILFFQNIVGQISFDIYGPIEDIEYWNECQEAIKSLSKNIVVTYKGIISHDKVHTTFSQYHAFLFPTLSENFGHVIAESLTVGCPVIISDQTPWNDVFINNAGWALPLNEHDSFIKAIQTIVDIDSVEYKKLQINAKKYINKKYKLEDLRIIYNGSL